jgi:Ca-activated chloride channel homolog
VSFSSVGWLWLLVLLVPVLLLEWRAAKRSAESLRRLVGSRADHVLLSQRRPGHRRIGVALRLSAVALLVLGAAGPEWGQEVVRRSAMGSDVALLLDVSASMDVRDVPPSRLEEARREALAVLERLQGSRVGVVAFAGDAVRLCPLTLDRGAVRLVLESITSNAISEPGSDLGKGLRMAARVLPGRRRTEQVIVLWTDGEDLERGAAGAIEELGRSGFRVLAVGVGTAAGDVVPTLDDAGRAVDVKRDANGGPVRSRLDEPLLRGLARRTRGAYFSASRPGGELPRLLAALGSVARGDRGQRLVERPVPRFPWCAGAAALLLAIELGRGRRRRTEDSGPAARRRKRSVPQAERSGATGQASTAAALLALLLAAPAHGQSAWARGDRAFREQRYPAAESLYARRLRTGGPAAVRVNRATARALTGGAAAAESALVTLIDAPAASGATAAYNLGTLQAARGRFDEALASLRHALEREPKDPDARYNYELALRRRREQGRQGSPPPTPADPTPRGGGPSPTPTSPSPTSPSPQLQSPQPQPQGPPTHPGAMDRSTAEQLMGSLNELERLEQQRLRKVRVVRERRGRDW